jgi:hypothetical protein
MWEHFEPTSGFFLNKHFTLVRSIISPIQLATDHLATHHINRQENVYATKLYNDNFVAFIGILGNHALQERPQSGSRSQ